MENESVRSVIEELNAVRRQAQVWRSLLVIVLLVFVVSCVSLLWNAASSLAQEGPKRDRFVQKIGMSMQNDILPKLKDVGAEVARRVDFNKQIATLNQSIPKVAGDALGEVRLFAEGVPEKGMKVVSDEFSTALESQGDKLNEEFPEATDEQLKNLMSNMTNEAQYQLGAIMDQIASEHITTMNDILADMKAIQALEGEKASTDVPTIEMVFLISDILRADYDEAKAEIDAATESEKAGKGKK